MKRMPTIFVGHGSPMNAIEDNDITKGWKEMALGIEKPKVILSVSAHWYTRGTLINDQENPRTIYDMYGFPNALYEHKYDAPGSPETAEIVRSILEKDLKIDNSWGIDHGTWSVLTHMYPDADIPVLQLSIDMNKDKSFHYEIGERLSSLRDKGVLIIGSGNIVHDLSRVNWKMDKGYDSSYEFDNYIKEKIIEGDHKAVLNHETLGQASKLAFKTPEHFYPLLYVLGASSKDDPIKVYNDLCTLGSISMTSYVFG